MCVCVCVANALSNREGGLTNCAYLLFDLIRHCLVEVLELNTQTKIAQLDGGI